MLPGENVRVDPLLFLLSFSLSCSMQTATRGKGRTQETGNGEGKSALSVHSHPFGHSSSISGPDVECNSQRKARGKWREEGEDKVPGVEAGGARWKEEQGKDSGHPRRKKERKVESIGKGEG